LHAYARLATGYDADWRQIEGRTPPENRKRARASCSGPLRSGLAESRVHLPPTGWWTRPATADEPITAPSISIDSLGAPIFRVRCADNGRLLHMIQSASPESRRRQKCAL